MRDNTQSDQQQQTARVGVVAGCIIHQDGKYLLIQEKQPKVYGKWNLPAGHVDNGETIEQAAVREAMEETGYEVKLLRKIDIYHEDMAKPVKHFFLAMITGGDLRIQPEEILDARWFTYEELSKLNNQNSLRATCVWDALTAVELSNV